MSLSTNTSMSSDEDKGMSMGTSMGMGKDAGTSDSAMCIGKVRREPGLKEHLASEGGAHSTSALEPKVLGRNMDDPLSKGIPFVGLSLQTGTDRQRPADAKCLQATDGSAVGGTEVVEVGADHTLGAAVLNS